MRFPHGETITVIRATTTGTDDYGNAIEGWDTATETTIPGCAVALRSEPESGGYDSPAVLVGITVYAPAGTDIRHTDRVRVRGVLYEVDGIPGDWMNPFTGWNPGLEVALRRSEAA